MLSEAHNSDCLAAMREMPDKCFELAIVDVPFGLNEGKKHATRTIRCKQRNGSFLNVPFIHTKKDWDESQPSQLYFNELFRVSRKQIIFGENYLQFDQKAESSGRIFWDKLTSGDFSHGELMWTNLFSSIRRVVFMWSGFNQGISLETPFTQQGNKRLNEKRIHPVQKPVVLYSWLLTNYAKTGDRILDTHLGSGSSRIAAYDLGFDFVGYELDKDYFETQEARFKTHCAQPKLFVPEVVQPEQVSLI
jgi:site-specific DNA-methyltransferase (adenine-specific)